LFEKWRVVGLEVHDGFMNMAIDEAVSEGVSKGVSPPTVRFYRWKPSAVSIGCFQSLVDEVDVKKCEELGIDYVRRRTGGGAVYHDYNGEITYSVIAPVKFFPKSITESYKVICGWIIDGLKLLGVEGYFQPINDIIVGGKKISGNAQTRRGNVLLQHGTILYDLDLKLMFTVLKVGEEKISDKMIKSVEERVTRLLNHVNVSMKDVTEALIKAFTEEKEYAMETWTKEELTRAKELVDLRYKTKEWNFSR
jgi:lipoate-protein ligase A